MLFIKLSELPSREKIPGYHVRFVHSATMTFAHWEIEAGAELSEHSHPHEQVADILDGEFELTIGGETRRKNLLLDRAEKPVLRSIIVQSGGPLN